MHSWILARGMPAPIKKNGHSLGAKSQLIMGISSWKWGLVNVKLFFSRLSSLKVQERSKVQGPVLYLNYCRVPSSSVLESSGMPLILDYGRAWGAHKINLTCTFRLDTCA